MSINETNLKHRRQRNIVRRRRSAELFQVELLEMRRLLSISSDLLTGPELSAGTVSNFAYTVSGSSTTTGTYTVTGVGSSNFGGQSAFESDDTTTLDGTTSVKKTYLAQNSQGLVEYGWTVDSSVTTNYAPPSVVFPATVVAGETYTLVSTGTTAISDVTYSFSDTVTAVLSSDATQSIGVPAGVYNCYVITGTTSNIPDITKPTETIQYSQTIDIAPGVGIVEEQVVQTPAQAGEGGTGFTDTYALSSFVDADHLAFQQQPQRGTAGITLNPPVTVQVQNSGGAIDSSATGSVTLSLNINSGTGTLSSASNMLTEPVVGGVATFSDLSISAPGSYTFSASDNATPAVAPGTSSLFNVTDTKLVFRNVLTKTDVDEPLEPTIVVELQDAKGNIITTNSTSVITLALAGSYTTSPLEGNLQATLSGGVALLPNITITSPGTYVLQATDGTDGDAMTTPFVVSADTLEFSKQPPGTINAGKAIPLTVELLDAQGKKNKFVQAGLSLSLNILSPGTVAVLGGTTALKFKGGVAAFTSANGPILHTPGTYTFTATEQTDSTGIVLDSTSSIPIVSDAFDFGEHLVFRKQPARNANVSIGTTVPFSVALENKAGATEPDSVDQVVLDLYTYSVSTGVAGTTPTATFKTTLVKGVATFSGISFTTLGTFYFDAKEYDGTTGALISGTDGAGSHVFSVTGLQVVFNLTPHTLKAGFTTHAFVALKDSDGVTLRSDSVDQIFFMAFSEVGGVSTPVAQANPGVVLDHGTAQYDVEFSIPGTYYLQADEYDASGLLVATTTSALSPYIDIIP